MSIDLHLLNAKSRLSPLEKRIISEFKNSVDRIETLIPVKNVDVVISASSEVIPETGLVGYCPKDDLVYLRIDPNNSNLQKSFSEEFTATLGHEFHHAMRWREVGYGTTLGEALISEGLACCFEAELRTSGAPFYAKALNEHELSSLWIKAKNELSSSTYDHFAWFLGSNLKSIPRYAGYSLGYQLVIHYIKQFGVPASKLYATQASSVLEHVSSHEIFD
ncbi:DUF2268 domain-containing putative Zn-dependent protease [Vibrio sp. WXL210]|uniref:DUF2268 domain-containing putative Zn-dependent protease n=1 Tax=Vibrio sp. WXL210 TaxID=3450709 RepID=UPI003EC4C2CF